MNRTSALLLATVFSCLQPPMAASQAERFNVIDLGPNHRTLESISVDPAGQPLTNRVVQLASGINWMNPVTGEYEPSQSEFEIAADGSAVISCAQTKVIASPNINNPEGALDILAADGRRLRCTVLGICLFDAASGQQLQVAAIRDSVAELVAPNTLLWRDCFEGLSADLRVVYELGAIHHDVIVRERIDPKLLARLGFSEENLRIEVWTEFLEATEPTRVETVLRSETDQTLREAMVEPDLIDEALDFGEMKFASGRAFAEPLSGPAMSVGVGKRFYSAEGRRFLIESCKWDELQPMLEQLPVSDLRTAAVEPGREVFPAFAAISESRTPLPPPSGKRKGEVLVAQNRVEHEPGLVLDFVGISGTLYNHVFTNETYQVVNNVYLSSSVTFEGGAVIKFNPGKKLYVYSSAGLYSKTDQYEPVVFTARDDDTVGAVVSGSTGSPSGTYANPALEISRGSYTAAGELANIRILYATRGIYISGNHYGSGPTFRNVQMVQCASGLKAYNAGTIKVLNGLFHDVGKVFDDPSYTTTHAEHLTVHDADWLNYSPYASNLYLVNSLLVEVVNPGAYSGTSVVEESDASSVFEEVGAGHHYLQTGSEYRNAGVTSIDADLAESLKHRTTYSPVIYSTPITEDTEFEAIVWRDVDDPDLGYHYDPIDLAICDLQATAATVTLTNGVVVATYGQNGFWLSLGATLTSGGRPDERNHITRFNTVMEQPENWGNGNANFVTINPFDTNAASTVVLRFTDLEQLAGTGYHTYANKSGWNIGDLRIADSSLLGGQLYLSGPSTMTIDLKNSLFLSVNTWLSDDHQLSAYNNLFRRGAVTLFPFVSSWVLKDNVFDHCQIVDMCFIGTPTHSHNAYVNTTGRILTAATGDLTLSSLAYESSDLGGFYQPSSATVLKDAGSRTAGAAGMAQHTATAALEKDTGTVDIGLHYVATVGGDPIDTDQDGLPDYYEDANGNGAVDVGETKAALAVSNVNGVLDGEEKATQPKLYQFSYSLEAYRDYTAPTEDRGSDTPDADLTVEWGHRGASFATSFLDHSECEVQYGDDLWALEYYDWSDHHLGIREEYTSSGHYTEESYGRPPTTAFPIPYEYCSGVTFNIPSLPLTPAGLEYQGTYTRSAETVVKLKSRGSFYPKPEQAIVLFVQVWDKSDGAGLRATENAPHGERRLYEPEDDAWGQMVEPWAQGDHIKVSDKAVDANGCVMVKVRATSDLSVYPHSVNRAGNSVDWYAYAMNVVASKPKRIRLSWSQHPLANVADGTIQSAFDNGAENILGCEQDNPIADWDPKVFQDNNYILDHAPTYLEFLVPPAQQATFPAEFSGQKYWEVDDRVDAVLLLADPFANIKVVGSIRIAGEDYAGLADFYGNPSFLVIEDSVANDVALLHETMHLFGLMHRGTEAREVWEVSNPSVSPPTPDPESLMHPNSYGHEFNRHERDTIYNKPSPAFWSGQ